MRIATVHLLIDVDTDAEACDFCSETFRSMPYLVDWAHAHPARPIRRLQQGHDLASETTVYYAQLGDYTEGDFLQAARAITPA